MKIFVILCTETSGLRLSAYSAMESLPFKSVLDLCEGLSTDSDKSSTIVSLPTPARAKFFTISTASGLFEPVMSTWEEDRDC